MNIYLFSKSYSKSIENWWVIPHRDNTFKTAFSIFSEIKGSNNKKYTLIYLEIQYSIFIEISSHYLREVKVAKLENMSFIHQNFFWLHSIHQDHNLWWKLLHFENFFIFVLCLVIKNELNEYSCVQFVLKAPKSVQIHLG